MNRDENMTQDFCLLLSLGKNYPLFVAPIDIKKDDIIEFSMDFSLDRPICTLVSIIREGQVIYPIRDIS